MEKSSPDEKDQLLDQLVKEASERRQAQKELRGSYHLLSTTFEALLDAVFIIDADGVKIIRSNRAASEMFGYTQAEMFGRTTEFLHVDKPSLEEFRRHLHPAIEKHGYLRHFQFRMRRKDGTIFPTEHSVMPLIDEKGSRFGWVSLVRDITERKQAEEALRKSEERYRSLFKENHSVILLIDPETADVVDANPAAAAFYGYSIEELRAKKITDINTLSQEEVFQEMDRARREERNHFHFKHRLATGEVRDVEVFSGPVNVHDKDLLCSVIHDISERRQIEEEPDQLNKELREALANIETLKKTRNDRGAWESVH